MPLTLGNILFNDEELSYDNSARPLILESAQPISGQINSFLRKNDGDVLTFYNPTVQFLPRSWILSVQIPESKYVQVLDLILEQNDRQDVYRSTLDINLFRGYQLIYGTTNVYVWITDIAAEESELDVKENTLIHKCTINLTESEVQ